MSQEHLARFHQVTERGIRANRNHRIGAQVLSHFCDLFPQVASWLLFIIGCLNILVVRPSPASSFLCSYHVISGHFAPHFCKEAAPYLLLGECLLLVSTPHYFNVYHCSHHLEPLRPV